MERQLLLILLCHSMTVTRSHNIDLNIFGHRGGMVQLVPEHTYASYALGAQAGADYLEQDLVFSADGHLIVLHDVILDRTTDIASHPEFANRTRTYGVWYRGNPDNYTEGQPSSMVNYVDNTTGWFAHDFTLAELKTLYANSGDYPNDSPFNDMWQILTFEESLQFVHNLSATLNRSIGVIPETK